RGGGLVQCSEQLDGAITVRARIWQAVRVLLHDAEVVMAAGQLLAIGRRVGKFLDQLLLERQSGAVMPLGLCPSIVLAEKLAEPVVTAGQVLSVAWIRRVVAAQVLLANH